MQSRREFLRLLGTGPAGIYLSSFCASAVLPACDSSGSAAVSSLVNWEEIRKNEFGLREHSAYMNNSTLGPTLKRVSNRMAKVQELFSAGMSTWDFVRNIVFSISPVRDLFTSMVNGHTDADGRSRYTGIVNSVTDGMSLIANGLEFMPGDGILITDHEHTGGKTMWELQRDRHHAVLYEVPLTVETETEEQWENGLLARFESYLKNAPIKVVSFSYITTSTGHMLPVKKLCRLAKDYGAVSVVDAAQAFGVVPLDVQNMDCDFLVVNGHKYLCGPAGTGFICIHPRMLEHPGRFWPTIVDENYYNSEIPARSNPVRKGGLKAFTNILPLAEALAFYQSLSPAIVHDRLAGMGRWLKTGLSRFPEIFEVLTPFSDAQSCSMTCFRIKGMESGNVSDLLAEKYRIIAKHATEGGADAVRLSPHYYTRAAELEKAAAAICEIAGVDLAGWLEQNELYA